MKHKRHKQIFKGALLTKMEISYWHNNFVGCYSEKNYYIVRCKAPRKRIALIKALTIS